MTVVKNTDSSNKGKQRSMVHLGHDVMLFCQLVFFVIIYFLACFYFVHIYIYLGAFCA